MIVYSVFFLGEGRSQNPSFIAMKEIHMYTVKYRCPRGSDKGIWRVRSGRKYSDSGTNLSTLDFDKSKKWQRYLELGPMISQKGTTFIDWKTVMHIPELVSSIQLGLIVNRNGSSSTCNYIHSYLYTCGLFTGLV